MSAAVRGTYPIDYRRARAAKLYGDGLSLRAIGDELGTSRQTVLRDLRALEVARRPAAPVAREPHGTHARYSRGCRCEPCRVGQRDYMRRRRAGS